ncbi:S9 family peptidase [Nakamurella endophytica]
MSGLVLSPDGSRLVVGVAVPDTERTRYVTSLWEVDPAGRNPARRLTRGVTGEASAAWTADGDLLFTSRRRDPEADKPDDEAVPLWLLPAAGGEARVLLTRPAGVHGVLTARRAPTALLLSPVLPGATDPSDDDALQRARKQAGVTAVLHSGYPVRFWDHDLGPERPRLLRVDLGAGAAEEPGRPTARLEPVDLTPDAGGSLDEVETSLSEDGRTAVTAWYRPVGRGDRRSELKVVDVATGDRRTLLADPDADLGSPRISPDGRRVAYLRETVTTPDAAPQLSVHVVELAPDGGAAEPVQLARGTDLWITGMAWLPDGSGLVVAADRNGRGPVALVRGDDVQWLTEDDWTYTDLRPAPDGSAVYALRTGYLAPSHPVRIPLTGDRVGQALPLPAPVAPPELPGRLTEVTATAPDGVPVRAWLALPEASAEHPAPLLLWVHGGPLSSWNAWTWRWNPWLMVARGYAVLLPDPGLSTGYGQSFLQRGWGAWGQAPFTDLMAVTDAVQARPDIDADRTGAMGGSFGGYMANWIAGHTDRFRAIVTHASLWALDDFGGTTDVATYWAREMTTEMARQNSPHLSVGDIRTPMLVVHGDRDYRVPIGQGLRLWFDLLSASGLPMAEDGSTVHRFLYFPQENHWVLTPQHAKLWYEVVLGFLAEHVLGQAPAAVPALLGGPGTPALGATGA